MVYDMSLSIQVHPIGLYNSVCICTKICEKNQTKHVHLFLKCGGGYVCAIFLPNAQGRWGRGDPVRPSSQATSTISRMTYSKSRRFKD